MLLSSVAFLYSSPASSVGIRVDPCGTGGMSPPTFYREIHKNVPSIWGRPAVYNWRRLPTPRKSLMFRYAARLWRIVCRFRYERRWASTDASLQSILWWPL